MRKFIIARYLALLVLVTLFSARINAASGPPSISQQPQNRSVSSAASTSMSVVADGTTPLQYKWLRNGIILQEATNATLLFPSVSFTQYGAYSVTINNSLGSITSTTAFLVVDAELTFRVTAFRTNGAIVVDHNALTDDDRGGIAVSASNVFVTGDAATA